MLLIMLGLGPAWYVDGSAYKSFMAAKHCVWRLEPADKDPYREVNRLTGAVRRYYDLVQADIAWKKLGESDVEVAAQCREKRAELARESGLGWGLRVVRINRQGPDAGSDAV